MRVADENLELNKASLDCSKHPEYCANGKKKSDKELEAMNPVHRKRHNEQTEVWPWAEWAERGERAPSWPGSMVIDPGEFDDMLGVVGDDVQDFSIGWYDTPFWNRYGMLEGTGNIYGNDYNRSDINYVGEGEAWAALGKSKSETQNIVAFWKEIVYWHRPSDATFKFTDVGYDY